MFLNFFNNLEKNFNIDDLISQYKNSNPLSHIIVDNFLPTDMYKKLCDDISNYPQDKWSIKNLPNSGIRKEARDFIDSPVIQQIMIHLTSHMFVEWMSKITGCDDIIPDIHHLGAGMTSAPAGTSLGLHIDFNWNNTLKLNRKFNLILYCNETWQEEWNGNLEFWNNEKTQCLYTLTPRPNRLIFWEYEQSLVHGHPKVLKCPNGVERQNLMTIYYSSNATPTSQPHKSDFY
jgi:Rps23 Pro-64 3,4-dihydroxylase Tpa1-like proline 4-hydroxylase